ncbi:hypothetical protein PSCLAVI8L_130766 [Pseudoclavibacter sp. 8L]|nr:hypothetical protein PSCLAVI8L_130766 [Pseudoclavibacter sp. 8L]
MRRRLGSDSDQVASASNGTGPTIDADGSALEAQLGREALPGAAAAAAPAARVAALAVAEAAFTGAGCGAAGSSSARRASRMMRRGSYWRGSSFRQSTSAKSSPISSFMRDFAFVDAPRSHLTASARRSAAFGSLSGPMMKAAIMPINSNFSNVSPNTVPS